MKRGSVRWIFLVFFLICAVKLSRGKNNILALRLKNIPGLKQKKLLFPFFLGGGGETNKNVLKFLDSYFFVSFMF